MKLKKGRSERKGKVETTQEELHQKEGWSKRQGRVETKGKKKRTGYKT